MDPLGLYNPISGPSGPVGSGTGLPDASIYYPSIPTGSSGAYVWQPMAAGLLSSLDVANKVFEHGSGKTTIGNNLKLYPKGFQGNKYVKTIKVAKCASAASPWFFAAGTVLDARDVSSGDMGWEHFGLNTALAALGTFGGPPGAAVGGTYSAIDKLYPGGWEGYGSDQGKLLKTNMQLAPWTWSLAYPIIGP